MFYPYIEQGRSEFYLIKKYKIGISREESAPEGDPGCVGKMEWRKM